MKKRFLLIGGFSDSVIKFRGDLLREIVDAGWQVYAAAPGLSRRSENGKKLLDIGVVPCSVYIRRVGKNPFQDLASFFSLMWLMLRIRPSFMMAYTIKPVIYGSIAARLACVSRRFALITGLGYSFEEERKNSNLRYLVNKLYRISLTGSHRVFFQNPDDEKLFREKAILARSVRSLVINGSGVEMSRFSVCSLPKGPLRFLLIARLISSKGVREYVEAAKMIRAQYPGVRFYLVGWIDDNPNAISQSELASWISEGLVEFLGRLDDVRSAIGASNVFVLPSYREGTPRTVLEAMAMGRPIITTDAPGCRETVINGENGYLVPVADAGALASAMKKFIDQPNLVEAMGRRSREIAEEKYDVRKVNDVMLRGMGIR